MQTRLRTGSLTRRRQHSIESESERHSSLGSLEIGISDNAGAAAQLVAGLKDGNMNTRDESATVSKDDDTSGSTGVATRTRSAARAVPIPQGEGGGAAKARSLSVGSQGDSSFLSGIMNNNPSVSLSHTPPAATSYEQQHFGKRPRAGSVSGRLRSASDLEDKGIIDRNEKAALKDLIISGDEELQAALDKYERGDTAPLQNMIRSGELMNRHAADIDLLGDLDLDFLNVDDHHYGADASVVAAPPPVAAAAAQPAPAAAAAAKIPPNMISDDDGIANLGELHGDEEFLQLSANRQAAETRFRSNSLAYGPLLNEHGSSTENVQIGRWMDREVREGRVGSVASSSADAPPPGVGGLAESLAQYAKQKGEAKPLTKAQLAEQKRRERQEKKEQKEREKAERKEQRERERAAKKEREAREKKERKEKKAASLKVKQMKEKEKQKKEEQEEPKVIVSGTGRPRSMSDPNLTTSIDDNGLMCVDRPDGWVGAYSPESRKIRIDRFMAKRNNRVWTKKVKYNVRKDFADSRLRVKGRFVKKEDESLMRDLMSLT